MEYTPTEGLAEYVTGGVIVEDPVLMSSPAEMPISAGSQDWRACRGPLAGRFYFRSEYLLWWSVGARTGPLVTTAPAGTDRENAGVIGEDGTEVLFGEASLAGGARSGQRYMLGLTLPRWNCTAIEATYLGSGTKTNSFHEFSSGDPILARPYQDILTGDRVSQIVAYPDWVSGELTAAYETKLDGVEVLLRRKIMDQCWSQLDLVVGWRHNRLTDELRIHEVIESASPQTGIAVGSVIDLTDRFRTQNQFDGIELGFVSRSQHKRFGLELGMKLALGGTKSRAEIDGYSTVTTVGDDSASFDGGLLAQPTNMGIHQRSTFSVIPELNATLSYQLNARSRFIFGYTFLYWSDVARAADQIDHDLNTSQFGLDDLAGPAKPSFAWQTTSYWAQGLQFGFDHRF